MVDISLSEFYEKRRIVVHHTHILKDQIIQKLKPKDLVFFDDCLYSQYVFIKEHTQFFIDNDVKCILGFSSGLYAPEDCKCQMHDIESHILHDACNKRIKTLEDADSLRTSLLEMTGFMKPSQLEELLSFCFTKLALHGCCHLNLENEKNIIKKAKLFTEDLKSGLQRLKTLQMKTDTFVYPYDYQFPTSSLILKKNCFNKIVEANIFRISIENIK